MLIKEIRSGTKITLKMETNIKTSFIFTVTARGVEEAIYDKGVLQYFLCASKTKRHG